MNGIYRFNCWFIVNEYGKLSKKIYTNDSNVLIDTSIWFRNDFTKSINESCEELVG